MIDTNPPTTNEGRSADSQGHGPARELAFSLFFFSSDGATSETNKYRLLHESATFADRHGFSAIWTPERHFDAFGGLYPNPAVISSSLAMITRHVQLRAGSVVLPLQNPIRVAEEWSVVDNLSNGRAAISVASGWQVNDFALAPDSYADRRNLMFERIDMVQRLWRGETIKTLNGAGHEVELKMYPKPIQRELPIWITCQSEETFVRAGAAGFNILVSLVYTRMEDLAQNIALYRMMRKTNGHEPQQGLVTLMLHTFLGADLDSVRETAQGAYGSYLEANLAFQGESAKGQGIQFGTLTPDAKERLIGKAVERLFTTHGLIGTPESCLPLLHSLKAIGVDEIACLIDFGIDPDLVIAGLDQLNQLRQQYSHKTMMPASS